MKINNIEMYSTDNKGRSVVAERFIRTLKNNIFKHMAAISKSSYFDVFLMLNTMKILIKKGLNLRLVIVSEYYNTKTFLLKGMIKTGQKKFSSLVKLKIHFHGLMLLVT